MIRMQIVDLGRALLLKLESPNYSYGVRSFDDVTILHRLKYETLGSPTSLSCARINVTIYVTVAPRRVSSVSLFLTSASPFKTTDSGPVRIDVSCVLPQPSRVMSCWVPCFYFI
ncbi:uncharacterized protein TNCV_1376681 [Trichonephila clavipes]|nr:uncharacterized protein TNCV_1376681 [Trichonephila clavipes]